jgi:hypothetical protein
MGDVYLTVTRLDRFWISADRDGIFYEFDRRDGILTYASNSKRHPMPQNLC